MLKRLEKQGKSIPYTVIVRKDTKPIGYKVVEVEEVKTENNQISIRIT